MRDMTRDETSMWERLMKRLIERAHVMLVAPDFVRPDPITGHWLVGLVQGSDTEMWGDYDFLACTDLAARHMEIAVKHGMKEEPLIYALMFRAGSRLFAIRHECAKDPGEELRLAEKELNSSDVEFEKVLARGSLVDARVRFVNPKP